MIEYSVLRQLVLDVLAKEPKTQVTSIIRKVQAPRKEMLSHKDKIHIRQIIWDLIVERILTVGMDELNDDWPWLRLTEYGEEAVKQSGLAYYDPDGYIRQLKALVRLLPLPQYDMLAWHIRHAKRKSSRTPISYVPGEAC